MSKYSFAELEDSITNDDFPPSSVFIAGFLSNSDIDLVIDADNGKSYVFLAEDKDNSSDLRIWVPVMDSKGRVVCLMTDSIVSMVAV